MKKISLVYTTTAKVVTYCQGQYEYCQSKPLQHNKRLQASRTLQIHSDLAPYLESAGTDKQRAIIIPRNYNV